MQRLMLRLGLTDLNIKIGRTFMKTLIVYYSQTRGNTRRIAEMIKKATSADIAEIKKVVPYEGTYEEIVEQGKDEVNHGYTPEIIPINIDGYDRIIIGSPTWWYTMAPAVKTFIESTDFTGKTVVPFITHGGWPAHAVADMVEGLREAKVEHEKEIQFDSTGGDELVTEQAEIDAWIGRL